MANPAISALQETINRYANVGGFAPVPVDGGFGPKTKQGVLNSLSWIVNVNLLDSETKQTAGDYVGSWDGINNIQLTLIALFLGNVANNLKLAHKSNVSPGTTVTVTPTPTPSSPPPASVSDTWSKVPTWAKVLGGVVAGTGMIYGVSKVQKRK